MSSMMTSLRKAISVITNNRLDHKHFGNSLNAGDAPQKQKILVSISSQPLVHDLENSSQGVACNQADLVEAGVDANSVTSNKRGYVMGYWTEDEDKLLVKLVGKYGERSWPRVAKGIPSRNGKQCRERWQNILSPCVKHGDWTEEEDEILINAHSRLGFQWSKISKLLPGRTGNAIKNHWNATKRKNLSKKNLKNITRLQHYIATTLNPKGEASKTAPLQTQPNGHNFNGAPITGYPFLCEGNDIPELSLGTNFALLYYCVPTYGAERSGSSAGGSLIRNQAMKGAPESSEVVFKESHCSCDKGKCKVGEIHTCRI